MAINDVGSCACGSPLCKYCTPQVNPGVGYIGFHPYTTGWECPKCRSVYSPATTECYKCNGPVQFTCHGGNVGG